jgi:hypothetical protein
MVIAPRARSEHKPESLDPSICRGLGVHALVRPGASQAYECVPGATRGRHQQHQQYEVAAADTCGLEALTIGFVSSPPPVYFVKPPDRDSSSERYHHLVRA